MQSAAAPGHEDLAPAAAQDPDCASGPASLLPEVAPHLDGADAMGEGTWDEHTAPPLVQQDRRGEVLGDGVLRKAADLVERLSPNHDVRAADKGRVACGLTGTQHPIEDRLLVVGPAGDGVLEVPVVLAR